MGLFDAATVTGSAAMPATEPGPSGTCSAYAAHPDPMRADAGSALGAADDVVISLVADSTADSAELVAEDAVLDASSLEQAAAPKMARAAKPAAAVVFRWIVVIFLIPSRTDTVARTQLAHG